MASDRKTTKIPGLRYREHPTRKIKKGMQKDRYYIIYYHPTPGERKEEGLGWASRGWTEKKAAALLFELKENIRLGRRPRTYKEKREMQAKAAEEEKQHAMETEADTITLSEIYKRYSEIYQTRTAKSTFRSVCGYYRKWIEPVLGKRRLSEITVDDMQSIISDVLKTRTPRTADYVKTILRQLFNFARSRDLYLKDNPAIKIEIKLSDNKRTRFLTPNEAEILLNELKKRSINMHDMALISLYNGLRAGEIFNLTWERVYFDIDRLYIADPKNGESRFEPMHPRVKELLQRRQQTDGTGYVFKRRSGGKMETVPDTYQRVVDKIGFNLGVTDPRQKVVFHTLRHTYASWLVMNGVDLYTTQKLLGHKTAQMTQRYAHLAPGHLEKAIRALPEINESKVN